MSTPSPARSRFDLSAWRPGRAGLVAVVVAIAIGIGLAFWASHRSRQFDFYRAGDVPPVTAPPEYAPLPAPLPAQADGETGASGMDREPLPAGDQAPRLAEPARPAPPPSPAPAAPREMQPPRPIAERSPAPRYPAQALRRGESGTVLVRVQVGPDGVPAEVDVARSSGSRLLDRAALDAVRRWRFTPAMADGRPVADTVQVPIDFRPER